MVGWLVGLCPLPLPSALTHQATATSCSAPNQPLPSPQHAGTNHPALMVWPLPKHAAHTYCLPQPPYAAHVINSACPPPPQAAPRCTMLPLITTCAASKSWCCTALESTWQMWQVGGPTVHVTALLTLSIWHSLGIGMNARRGSWSWHSAVLCALALHAPTHAAVPLDSEYY